MSVNDARRCVVEQVGMALRTHTLRTETVGLAEAFGRVLAEDVLADRDYPAMARSIRDGFAVRSADLPGTFEVIGESRAGGSFAGIVGPGQAVEIMTGAPVPLGADQVVMVEQTSRDGPRMKTERAAKAGEFINPQAAEIRRGERFVVKGRRIGKGEIAGLATVGRPEVQVYVRPGIAILPTGDEVIPIEGIPQGNQVRNSNAWALAAQVRRCGGVPAILPVACDDPDVTAKLVARGLQDHDMLLLSGGVSAGKYDYVEPVLATFGAEFFFDRALIQPGQPLVFGRAQEKFFFGLPGNPASTMVCFEVFGRAAVELLSGEAETRLPTAWARLTHDFSHKPGLTRFFGATLKNGEVTQIPSQGSSDVAALAQSDCFLIAEPDREQWAAGEMIRVLLG